MTVSGNVAIRTWNRLDLCSGIGLLGEGVGIAAEYLGCQSACVAHVERDSYAAAVLLARMAESSLEPAPIWDDLESFECEPWRGRVDCITAGFPCQPWSAAGKQQGTADERWLWPAIANIIRDVGPGIVFLENVPGLISGGGLDHVLGSLAEMRFDAQWLSLTAEAVGAAHRRERVFILAYRAESRSWLLSESDGRDDAADVDGQRESVADSSRPRGSKNSRSTPSDETANGRARRNGSKPNGDNEPECAQPVVGVTERHGGRQRQSRRGSDRRTVVGGAGPELVNAVGDGRLSGNVTLQRGGNQSAGRQADDAGEGCSPVADTAERRPQNEREVSAQGRESDSGNGSGKPGSTGCNVLTSRRDFFGRRDGSTPSPGIFAPGPSANWQAIPETLWPAIEPGFRLLVDGSAVVLDTSRADQLRCAGNSVVALCAAVAFVELVRRAGLVEVEPGASK